MGLNWAAALSNVADGMGRIAQVKYSEFMRQDEAKRREAEREIDFKRQQNLERFRIKAAQEAQQAGFTHAENLQDERIKYDQSRDEKNYDLQEQQIDISRQNAEASRQNASTSAAESKARLDLLKEQADAARADRALAEKLRMYQPSLDAANAEMKDLNKYKMDLQKNPNGFDPKQIADADARILELRQSAQAAQNGIMTEYLPNFRENLPPERVAILDQLLADGVPVLQAVDRTLKATPQKDVDPAATGNEFIPTGGTPGPKSSASVGVPQEDQQQFSKPPVSEYTTNEYGQIVPKISLQLALKQLDPRTVSRLQGQGHKSVLADDEIRHIKSLGYQPEDFRQMFRSGSY